MLFRDGFVIARSPSLESLKGGTGDFRAIGRTPSPSSARDPSHGLNESYGRIPSVNSTHDHEDRDIHVQRRTSSYPELDT